jgi:hypothetical protein
MTVTIQSVNISTCRVGYLNLEQYPSRTGKKNSGEIRPRRMRSAAGLMMGAELNLVHVLTWTRRLVINGGGWLESPCGREM